ncbi:Platinum sensitivity protein [Tilletia horrida]|uniref:Platinum sensitivity protein n=1 Tax=Tilletia horrida TaxID=155126 RepID=A0AAN6G5X9_9BASI|nr:Platinum sensitivity protein [Tilletia horrida]
MPALGDVALLAPQSGDVAGPSSSSSSSTTAPAPATPAATATTATKTTTAAAASRLGADSIPTAAEDAASVPLSASAADPSSPSSGSAEGLASTGPADTGAGEAQPADASASASTSMDVDADADADANGEITGDDGAPQPFQGMQQQQDIANSSILSPTSTVCRGSYHQCGTARRVKVYELQNDSWFDRGTGYCAGVYDELRDEALLVARKEEACTLLARNASTPVMSTPLAAVSALTEAGGLDSSAAVAAAAAAAASASATGTDAELRPSVPASTSALDAAVAGGFDASIPESGNLIPSALLTSGSSAEKAAMAAAGAAEGVPAKGGSAAEATSLQPDDTSSGVPGPSMGGDAGSLSDVKPFDSEYVIVVSEDLNTDDVILKSRVLRDDVYQRQAETLVVWTEADGTDMALSFQEAEGCHELWEFLTEVQKHFILVDSRGGADAYMLDPDGDDSPTGTPNPNSPTHTLGFGPGSMDDLAQTLENFNLPEPKLATLSQIELKLKDAASKGQAVRDRVAEWLLRENYIKKLLPVFQDAEELEVLDSLHLLCTIIQSILMLNDNAIFEHILQDDVFLGVVGMLEYDPEYPRSKASYRDYLSDPSRYRKVVEIKDEGIVRKIHQTYRLLYLKDVILARVLDDPTFSILNSFVFYNQVDIVSYCISNEGFLTELFEIFSPERKEPDTRKHEAVFFLQQLCAMGKQIQLPNRITLYRTLTEWGLLSVVEYALGQNDQTLRNAAAEVLMTIIEYDANSVRLHILEQADQNTKPLMTVLVDLLHSEEDLGLKTQMAEAVRVLLETNSDGPGATLAAAAAAAQNAAAMGGRAPGPSSDPDKFLTWLYDAEMEHLFSPLKELPDFRFLRGGRQLDLVERSRSALFGHLCDLLSFTMINHSFRSQFFLVSSEVSRRVASLLGAREKHIRLSALRFFKTCLNANNQHTNRYFTKIDLFGAVLGLVATEADRDNLVSSACLEFFDFIRRENMKPVIRHLLDNNAAQLQLLADHPIVGKTFTALALQSHNNSEVIQVEGDNKAEEAEEERRVRDLRRRAGNRAIMDAAEESYFNEDDDEEQSVPAGSSSVSGVPTKTLRRTRSSATRSTASRASTGITKLVDYDDDDEEDLDGLSVASSAGTAVGDAADDGSSAVSAASSSTTLAEASAVPAAAGANGEAGAPTPPRLKRRRSQSGDGSGAGAGGAEGGGDEDALERLAKKTATGSKRRSTAAAAASGDAESKSTGTGTGGAGPEVANGAKRTRSSLGADGSAGKTATKRKKEQPQPPPPQQEEEDEELEGGFIRVDTPTSPTAAKTTNAGRSAGTVAPSSGGPGEKGSGAESGPGAGAGTSNGSKKITLNLKRLGGKSK